MKPTLRQIVKHKQRERWALLVSVASIVVACGPTVAPDLEDEVIRPNLIIVLADQLRYQSVGYAGDAKAYTPNIDRRAAQGINFSNFVSRTPELLEDIAGL